VLWLLDLISDDGEAPNRRGGAHLNLLLSLHVWDASKGVEGTKASSPQHFTSLLCVSLGRAILRCYYERLKAHSTGMSYFFFLFFFFFFPLPLYFYVCVFSFFSLFSFHHGLFSVFAFVFSSD
jgi:hypothetical protein